MDKQLIDHDLSDIMKEIEALENDFKEEERAFANSPIIQELAQLNEQLSAPVSTSVETEEEKPFAWLSADNDAEPLDTSEAEIFEMKSSNVSPIAAVERTQTVAAEQPKATVIHKTTESPKTWSSSPSKMSMNFPEGMDVKMEFVRGHEVINFSWTQEGFRVEVEGGMSFNIPFSQSIKKAS